MISLGISPDSSLTCKCNIASLVRPPIWLGMVPFILLRSSSSDTKLERDDKYCGSAPLSSFLNAWKRFNPVSPLIVGGMTPWRPLLDICSSINPFRFPISFGMMPVREFSWTSRYLRFVRWPMDAGIVPTRRFLRSFRVSNLLSIEPISDDIGPDRILQNKSKCLRFDRRLRNSELFKRFPL